MTVLKGAKARLNAVRTALDGARTMLKAAGMTQNQENRTTMFGTVAAYMEQNAGIWNSMKAAADTVAELRDVNGQIAEKAGRQQAPTSGVAEDKAQVREDFEAKILEIGDQLSSIGAVRQDAQLQADVEFTKTGLGKLSDDLLEEAGKRVAARAAADLAALADYNIDAADLAELGRLADEFHEKKTGPRTSIAKRAGETRTLPELITTATDLLRDRLDKQMTRFRRSHPEFHAGYASARVVVDRGGASAGKPAPAAVPPALPK